MLKEASGRCKGKDAGKRIGSEPGASRTRAGIDGLVLSYRGGT